MIPDSLNVSIISPAKEKSRSRIEQLRTFLLQRVHRHRQVSARFVQPQLVGPLDQHGRHLVNDNHPG